MKAALLGILLVGCTYDVHVEPKELNLELVLAPCDDDAGSDATHAGK